VGTLSATLCMRADAYHTYLRTHTFAVFAVL